MNLLVLSELDDKPRSDRQNKAIAKAAAHVVDAPLSHAQWLQALRDGDLARLDGAYALNGSNGSVGRSEAVTLQIATDITVARTLGLDRKFGCDVADLRIGILNLEVDPLAFEYPYPDELDGPAKLDEFKRRSWSVAAMPQLLADVPEWLGRLTSANTMTTPPRHGPAEVFLVRPVRPGDDAQQMVNDAAAAAGIDPSAITYKDGEYPFGVADAPMAAAAAALARLDGRLPDGWTTHAHSESPGQEWPVATNVATGMAASMGLGTKLFTFTEQLTDKPYSEVVDPGGSYDRLGRSSEMLQMDDLGEFAFPSIGQVADVLAAAAHRSHGFSDAS